MLHHSIIPHDDRILTIMTSLKDLKKLINTTTLPDVKETAISMHSGYMLNGGIYRISFVERNRTDRMLIFVDAKKFKSFSLHDKLDTISLLSEQILTMLLRYYWKNRREYGFVASEFLAYYVGYVLEVVSHKLKFTTDKYRYDHNEIRPVSTIYNRNWYLKIGNFTKDEITQRVGNPEKVNNILTALANVKNTHGCVVSEKGAPGFSEFHFSHKVVNEKTVIYDHLTVLHEILHSIGIDLDRYEAQELPIDVVVKLYMGIVNIWLYFHSNHILPANKGKTQ